MIGLCFEGETICKACGKPIAINALNETFICSQCLSKNTISINEWKNLLESLFKEGPSFEENEGVPSTVFGGRNYNITYGRQNPKFQDTKTYIDIETAIKSVGSGKVVNPATNVAYSIRQLPESFKEACPNVLYLLCEDFTQLPKHNEQSQVIEQSSKGGLIPFVCPNCGGSLEISDSERSFKCQYCSTESYIPDDAWQKMHPVKTKQRFYFLIDEKTIQFN